MGKHTPGPWTACKEGKCKCGQIWSKTADHPVAEVTRGQWGDSYPALRLTDDRRVEAYTERLNYGEVPAEQSEANARLIAAAPELLAAADRVCWFDWSNNDSDAVQAIDALRAAIAKAES